MDLSPVKRDMRIFDGCVPILIEHNAPPTEKGGMEPQVDYSTMTCRTTTVHIKTVGVFTSSSLRNQGSVRQIFQRGASITQDSLPLNQCLCQIATTHPNGDPIIITVSDKVTNLKTNVTYDIVAVDKVVGDTRYRVVCQKLS